MLTKKPHECKVCGKQYTQASGLSNHMYMHEGEKPYGCDICGKRFKQPGSLKSHSRKHSGWNDNRYKINDTCKQLAQDESLN